MTTATETATTSADTRTLAACCRLAVTMAASTDELRDWWIEHQAALQRLSAPQRAWLVAAKDARRVALARETTKPAVAGAVWLGEGVDIGENKTTRPPCARGQRGGMRDE